MASASRAASLTASSDRHEAEPAPRTQYAGMRKLRPTLHWRVRHEGGHDETEFIELDPGELSGLFAAPPWLRDLGVMSWLLVGVTVLLVGMVWFLSLTNTIVTPVVTAAIIAAVLAPLVAWLKRHRVPRGGGAGIVCCSSWSPARRSACWSSAASRPVGEINSQLQSAADKLKSTLKDPGVSRRRQRTPRATRAARSAARSSLLSGLGRA